MTPTRILSDEEMERKFVEVGMQPILNGCTSHPKEREYRENPIKKKREYTVIHRDEQKDIRAIICHFQDADGTDRRSIRYLKDANGNEYER
jgi:hypothetical protein